MKKSFRLEDLDCANCARKMEDVVRRIDGVEAVTISYIGQRLTLEAADDRFDSVLDEAVRLMHKIEPDCRVVR